MKTTWGNWTRDGRSLVHDGYGIDVLDLARDPQFWIDHIAGKNWGDERTLRSLADAWVDITGAGEGMTSHVNLLVDAAVGVRGPIRDFEGTVAELLDGGTA